VGFSDLFNTETNDTLPSWLQQGAAVLDSGIDLYERIAGGDSEPTLPPMREQAAQPAYTNLLSPGVLLIAGVALFLLLRKR